jgi:non-specific protein-tyrosine kinase
MKELIELLVQRAEFVVFDSPPVLAVTDAAVLSRQVDGVLLVIEARRTRIKHARRALEELSQVDAPLLGVVLNKIPVSGPGSYSDYYFRDYYSSGSEGTAYEATPANVRDER